mgnify:CR=1 FL=1
MTAATVAELLGEWLAPPADSVPTPAKPAKAANRKDPCGSAADAGACEALRIDANVAPEVAGRPEVSQGFAALRSSRDAAQSEQRRGVSQDSQDSQGCPLNSQACSGPRPYRLTRAEADEAHAEAWRDSAIVRFEARTDALRRLGFAADDPDDLAERLHLRDVRRDDRRACVECLHLRARPWRCANHEAAAVARELAGELVTALQACPGFHTAR